MQKPVFPSWNSRKKYAAQLDAALNEYTNLKVRGAYLMQQNCMHRE